MYLAVISTLPVKTANPPDIKQTINLRINVTILG